MNTTENLLRDITKGIQEKKGNGIVIADLQKVEGAICKYFVICQGSSPLQVDAIANSVIDVVRDIAEYVLMSDGSVSTVPNGWRWTTPT